MLPARPPRPGSAFALPGGRQTLRNCLKYAGPVLVAIGCSGDQTTGPRGDRPIPQFSEATAEFLRDDFSDPNGTVLTSHVPDGGSTPFSWIYAPAWEPADPDGLGIIQDSAVTATGAGSWVYLTSVQAGDRAELVIDLFRPVSTAQDIVIYLRTAAANFDDGILTLWSLGPEGNFVQVDRNGLPGVLIQLQDTFAVGRHTFSAEIKNGNQIELAIDSTVVLSAPAGTLPASGRAGIKLWRNAAPDVRFTSFTVGTVPKVHLELVNQPSNVWPSGLDALDGASGPSPSQVQLRVRVNRGGVDLKDQVVQLSLTAIDSSGKGSDGPFGHFHTGFGEVHKPTGKLDPEDSVNTGSDGLQGVVKYTSSIVSGPILVRAEIEGALPDTLTIPVGVPGLVELEPGSTITLVGVKTIHPSSNWVTEQMLVQAKRLADAFSLEFHKPIGFNDASLRFGGKFDLEQQWDQPASTDCKLNGVHNPKGCHQRHRVGRNIDLDNPGMSKAEAIFARNFWELRIHGYVGVESGHYHIKNP
jgi:hypothetical protein